MKEHPTLNKIDAQHVLESPRKPETWQDLLRFSRHVDWQEESDNDKYIHPRGRLLIDLDEVCLV